ncbi:glucosamine-6-phosphate deaminase [Novosphingobium endophyticum]|uniref:Glucosamine-6-phosphate deaminase n=1 Tax=Novosphingobium endophyticum TaxID=1955250 RepID=A0A916X353_9SPHN|nr:SIS domain-containing protein [Novosphingobium endophyticum]GGB90309.1 glucosamine-6-phosphate deaminase [Novosphingobium endophyticum]
MHAEQTLIFAEAAQGAAVAERQIAELQVPLDALGRKLRDLDPPLVLTCARGSSDHAATFAKYLVETHALAPVASYAPSVSSLYETHWRKLEGTLFLAISQSGHSPDVVISARAARQAGALVVALVNDPHSPLALASDVAIPLHAGTERSVAASKSFIASLLAIMGLVAAWTGSEELRRPQATVPQALRDAWQLDWSPAVTALAGTDNLFVLGRGLNFAAAQEAALKLKETCGLHAEAFSAAEVQHGPAALVGPGFPVFMLTPGDKGREDFGRLADQFVRRGAPVIVVGGPHSGTLSLPFLTELHPAVAPLATIQSFYRFVAELAIARGRDPDRPPHLRKVTETR